ncbi:MAG: serine hydrolase domain-containing protein [Clostridiales bacterium]
MGKLAKWLTAVLLLISIAAGPAFGQNESAGMAEELEELTKTAEALVGEGKAKGAVLAIVREGEEAVCRGFGFADQYQGIAADGVKTAFRIGSISKTFVAVAAQLLVQEGRLDMDEDIAHYVGRAFPALAYPVTMGQLLTHTAGFEDVVTGIAVYEVSQTEPLEKTVVKYKPAQIFVPGEMVSYSNYGIALAAYVVEEVSGQDFAAFCREKIFLPLGMERTTFEYMQDIVCLSKPYLPNGQETLEPYINLYPEGSALSTAADMANYMAWLLARQDRRVLSPQSKKELFDRQFTMAGELAGMGYTWNRKTEKGRLYYDKKGETLNFYSRIALYPEAGAGIFFSSNTYLPEEEINALMDKATALLSGPEAGAGAGVIANQVPAGEAAIDISGYYVNHCSSFESAEKILRYLIPGKSLTITGSLAGGFAIKGTDLRLIGRDLYESPLGKIKFLNKEGEIILATESAITFSKAPFWQKSCFQVLPPLLFLVLTLLCLLVELRGFSSKGRLFIVLCCFLQLSAFVALAVLLYKGVLSFTLLSYGSWLKGGAGIILVSAVAGLAYGINKKTRQEPALLPAAWSLAGLLFSGWLYWLNLL